MNETTTPTAPLDRIVGAILAALFPALVGAITARWFTGAIGAATAQLIVTLALVIVGPLYTILKLRRVSWFIAVPAATAILFAVFFLSSYLFWKRVVFENLPGSPDLVEHLVNASAVPISDTERNIIILLGTPRVARDGRGDIHVQFDFVWHKRNAWERSYEGTVLLVARVRRSDAGSWSLDPFEVVDFSVFPKQGTLAHLLGWIDGPSLLAESGIIARWVQKALSPVVAP